MANTDLVIQVTAKAIGPVNGSGTSGFRTRPKVFNLQSQDLLGGPIAGLTYDDVILKLKMSPNRVRAYESVSDFIAAQALSQGATASIFFQSKYAAVTASGSTLGSATVLDATKYINEVNAGNGLGVCLPDPFVRKVCVVVNTTTGSINVFAKGGGTGAYVDGATAAVVIAAGKRKHFAAPVIPTTAGTTAAWQSAT